MTYIVILLCNTVVVQLVALAWVFSYLKGTRRSISTHSRRLDSTNQAIDNLCKESVRCDHDIAELKTTNFELRDKIMELIKSQDNVLLEFPRMRAQLESVESLWKLQDENESKIKKLEIWKDEVSNIAKSIREKREETIRRAQGRLAR